MLIMSVDGYPQKEKYMGKSKIDCNFNSKTKYWQNTLLTWMA